MFKFIKSLFKKKEDDCVWDTDTTKTTVPRVPSSQDEEPIPPGPPQLSTLLTKPFRGIPTGEYENMEPFFPNHVDCGLLDECYLKLWSSDKRIEEYRHSFYALQSFADKNHMTSCEYLGDLYASGTRFVKKVDEKRIYYWEKAGKLGSLTAVRKLAYSYGRGLLEFPIDYDKAHLYWYLLYDHNPADIEAKLYYLLGVSNGLPRDPLTAEGITRNALGEIVDELTGIPAAEIANDFWAFNQIIDMAERGDSRAEELIKQINDTNRTLTWLNTAMTVLNGLFA